MPRFKVVAIRAQSYFASIIVLSALWFGVVQLWVTRQICPWCMTVHACAVIAVILDRKARSANSASLLVDQESTKRKSSVLQGPIGSVSPLIFAILSVVAVVWTQLAFNINFGPRAQAVIFTAKQDQPTANGAVPPYTASSNYIALQAGMLQLWGDSILAFDPVNVPIVNGPADWTHRPESGVPVVLLHDWTCSHCCALHHALVAKVNRGIAPPAAEAEPNAVKAPALFLISALPVWKEPKGESVHRLMLTAWFGARSVYAAAEHALLSGELAPEPAAVEEFLSFHSGASWPVLMGNYAHSVEAIMQLGQHVITATESHLAYSSLPILIAVNTASVGNPTAEQLDVFLAQAAAMSPVHGRHLSNTPQESASRSKPVLSSFPALPAPNLATPSPAPSATLPPVVSNLSKIEFDSTDIRLPSLHLGEKVSASYHFTNTGNEPLIILGVHVSCGCTAVDGWEQTIPPQGKGVINITFDSNGQRVGMMSKYVTVRSNASNVDSTTNSSVLRFGATVLPERGQPLAIGSSPLLTSEPDLAYGLLTAGQPIKERVIKLVLIDPSLRIDEQAMKFPEFLQAALQPMLNDSHNFTLTVNMAHPQEGKLAGEIVIPLVTADGSAEPSPQPLRISVSGHIVEEPPFTVSHQEIRLPALPLEKSYSFECFVHFRASNHPAPELNLSSDDAATREIEIMAEPFYNAGSAGTAYRIRLVFPEGWGSAATAMSTLVIKDALSGHQSLIPLLPARRVWTKEVHLSNVLSTSSTRLVAEPALSSSLSDSNRSFDLSSAPRHSADEK